MSFLALASMQVLAEAPFAAPPQTPYGAPIGIESAKKAAAGCVSEAHKNKWNMAIAVVDSAGFLVYFERMQNTQLGSVDLAIEKARTSALFRRPTKVFQDAIAAGGDGLRLLRLTGANPNGGGVPIVVDRKVIGAIGISGGSAEQDAQVAAAQAYRGVIPADRWREPYMPADELEKEIADAVMFWVAEEEGRVLGVMGLQDKGEVALPCCGNTGQSRQGRSRRRSFWPMRAGWMPR